MKATLFTEIVVLLPAVMPGFGEEPLLFDTGVHSYFNPGRLDEFIQTHKAQYTEDYFKCSQEVQRLLREESDVRGRRCDLRLVPVSAVAVGRRINSAAWTSIWQSWTRRFKLTRPRSM